jgi:hypothetical protein
MTVVADTESDKLRMRELRRYINGANYRIGMNILTDKKFYYTKRWYIGFGPTGMQDGDIVCLILGANSPFVLRETQKDQYILVGEADCDGIMDGEFLESNPQERVFVIH